MIVTIIQQICYAGILMFSFIMGFYFLKKLILVQKQKRYRFRNWRFILNKLGYETPTRPWQRTKRSRIEPNLEQSQLTQDSSDTISSLSSDDDNSNPEIERLILLLNHYIIRLMAITKTSMKMIENRLMMKITNMLDQCPDDILMP